MRKDTVSSSSSTSVGKPIAAGWKALFMDIPHGIPSGYSTTAQIAKREGISSASVWRRLSNSSVPSVIVRVKGKPVRCYKD